MSALTQIAWHVLVIGGGIVAGAAIIPGVVYLLAKSIPKGVRGVLGRILWTIAAICNGRNLLYQTESGQYVMKAVEQLDAEHPKTWAFEHDDLVFAFDGPADRWSRLGKQPFGVMAEKTDDAFGRWGEVVVGDGGTGAQEPQVEIDMTRVMDHFRAAGDIQHLQRARRIAQRKFSGDGSLSTKWLAIATVFSAFAGGLTGLGLVMLL